jgi:hypothetical protein
LGGLPRQGFKSSSNLNPNSSAKTQVTPVKHLLLLVVLCAGSGTSKAGSHPEPLSWVACKGSKPEQRGYTCALWLLFHTTAAR